MMELVAWIVLSAGGLMVLILNLLNAFTWPRGRPDAGPMEFSVLVPARNEESCIEDCITSIALSPAWIKEIIVYDDGSTDRTPDILAKLQEELETLEVVRGLELPEGWVGKVHACHQLAERASGDVLLFVDADVQMAPEGLQRIASLFQDLKADAVTAVPRQKTLHLLEALVLPLLHLTYTSWLPLPLIWKSHDPRFLAANGQVLAIKSGALAAAGGFEAIRHEIVDDMAICRKLKDQKRRVVFADGHQIATCRMYDSPRALWEGFSKNLFEGIGGHVLGLMGLIVLYFTIFVAPYIAAVVGLWVPEILMPALVGVSLNVTIRLLLAWKHKHSLLSVVLHPIAVMILLAIAVNSWVWNARGAIHWSGRSYVPRGLRK